MQHWALVTIDASPCPVLHGARPMAQQPSVARGPDPEILTILAPAVGHEVPTAAPMRPVCRVLCATLVLVSFSFQLTEQCFLSKKKLSNVFFWYFY